MKVLIQRIGSLDICDKLQNTKQHLLQFKDGNCSVSTFGIGTYEVLVFSEKRLRPLNEYQIPEICHHRFYVMQTPIPDFGIIIYINQDLKTRYYRELTYEKFDTLYNNHY